MTNVKLQLFDCIHSLVQAGVVPTIVKILIQLYAKAGVVVHERVFRQKPIQKNYYNQYKPVEKEF